MEEVLHPGRGCDPTTRENDRTGFFDATPLSLSSRVGWNRFSRVGFVMGVVFGNQHTAQFPELFESVRRR